MCRHSPEIKHPGRQISKSYTCTGAEYPQTPAGRLCPSSRILGACRINTGPGFVLENHVWDYAAPQNVGMLRGRAQAESGVVCGLIWLQLSKMLRARQTPRCCPTSFGCEFGFAVALV